MSQHAAARRLFAALLLAGSAVAPVTVVQAADPRHSSLPALAARPPGETSTEQVEACVTAHDSARSLQYQDQWGPAREAMQACSGEQCPLALRADCSAWLEELQRALPSVLVVVQRDEEANSGRLEVELDGARFSLPEPPEPFELLPGPHRMRFVLPPFESVEVSFSLEKFEKNRVIQVRLSRPPARPKRASLHVAPRPLTHATRPTPLVTYLLGGAAVAAAAASAVLLASGLQERSHALDTCAPVCSASVRSAIDTRLVFADVTGGAALILGALSVYTFIERPTLLRTADFSPAEALGSPRGAQLSIRGEF